MKLKFGESLRAPTVYETEKWWLSHVKECSACAESPDGNLSYLHFLYHFFPSYYSPETPISDLEFAPVPFTTFRRNRQKADETRRAKVG